MNWFLLLIILGMAGGGYYEYQTLHGQVTVDDMQISDLKTKVQTALDDQQKSADAAKKLTADLADTQAKAADLDKQLQTSKTALAAAQAQIDAAAAAAKAAAATPATTATASPAAFTTKLGTIAALDGKTYTACQLLKISSASIVVSNAAGITEIALNVLPASTQKMLGYDPKLGALSNDQVQLLEQKRQTAMASGN
jgi:hypothetical protein